MNLEQLFDVADSIGNKYQSGHDTRSPISKTKITNCYFNLTKKCISYFQAGDKVQHCYSIMLEDVEFSVREGRKSNPQRQTRQWTLANNRKCVHAFVKGLCKSHWAISNEPEVLKDALNSDPVAISYNPYKAGYFYRKDNGKPVTSADIAIVSAKGVFAWGVK